MLALSYWSDYPVHLLGIDPETLLEPTLKQRIISKFRRMWSQGSGLTVGWATWLYLEWPDSEKIMVITNPLKWGKKYNLEKLMLELNEE